MDISNQFSTIELPELFIHNDKQYFYDAYRKKLILLTPEEKIRQKTLEYFKRNLNIPDELIHVELKLSRTELYDNRNRADIAITKWSDIKADVLAVIECKAEYVSISTCVLKQAFKYAFPLLADYFFIVNGIDLICYKIIEENQQILQLKYIPTISQMYNNYFIPIDFVWDF